MSIKIMYNIIIQSLCMFCAFKNYKIFLFYSNLKNDKILLINIEINEITKTTTLIVKKTIQ
jgi:hypothetical protein